MYVMYTFLIIVVCIRLLMINVQCGFETPHRFNKILVIIIFEMLGASNVSRLKQNHKELLQ